MLYIVATPIGNLSDISSRAIEILGSVDKIVAEDTRHSKQLLQYLSVKKPLISLHEHNEAAQTKKVIGYLQADQDIALISDAGTPLISDPGYRLVKLAHQQQIRVIPIPGPCALITALSAGGLPTDRFIFGGFLPAKPTVRRKYLTTLAKEQRTLVFYESPHRITATLADLKEIFGDEREAVLARELTKTFETIRKATLQELSDFVATDAYQRKGEIVLLVAGFCDDATKALSKANLPLLAQTIMQVLAAELPLKQAVTLAAKITNISKKALYDFGLSLKDK